MRLQTIRFLRGTDRQTDTCAVQTSDIWNDPLHCDVVLVNCTSNSGDADEHAYVCICTVVTDGKNAAWRGRGTP